MTTTTADKRVAFEWGYTIRRVDTCRTCDAVFDGPGKSCGYATYGGIQYGPFCYRCIALGPTRITDRLTFVALDGGPDATEAELLAGLDWSALPSPVQVAVAMLTAYCGEGPCEDEDGESGHEHEKVVANIVKTTGVDVTTTFVHTDVSVMLAKPDKCTACGEPVATYWSVTYSECTADYGHCRRYPWCTRCATDRGYAHLALWCEAMQAVDRAMRAAPSKAARDYLAGLTTNAAHHFAVWMDPAELPDED